MIKELPQSEGAVVGFQVGEKLTDEDYEGTLIPRLREAFAAGDDAKLLLYFDDTFDGFEAAAMWDDTKFGTKHRHDFSDMAIVGAPRWIGQGAKLFAPFLKGEVKLFEAEELDAAWDWVK